MAGSYDEVSYWPATSSEVVISFPFLDSAHVKVYVNSVLKTLSDDYTFEGSPDRVVFGGTNLYAPTLGSYVLVKRETPIAPLVDWPGETTISGQGLDTMSKQALYSVEEVKEGTTVGMGISLSAASVDVSNVESSLIPQYPVMSPGLVPAGSARPLGADVDLIFTPDVFGGTGQGNLQCPIMTATSFAAPSSDIRTKKNVEDSDLGLEFIKDIHPVKFQFKDESDLTGSEEDYIRAAIIKNKAGVSPSYGIIAQELKSTVDAHSPGSNLGWIGSGGAVETVAISALVGPLIKAVQELSTEVEDLTLRVAQLESN